MAVFVFFVTRDRFPQCVVRKRFGLLLRCVVEWGMERVSVEGVKMREVVFGSTRREIESASGARKVVFARVGEFRGDE